MNRKDIEKMISNAEYKWAINNMFAMDCKRNSDPDAFLYTLAKIKYSRIIKRLKKAEQNFS